MDELKVKYLPVVIIENALELCIVANHTFECPKSVYALDDDEILIKFECNNCTVKQSNIYLSADESEDSKKVTDCWKKFYIFEATKEVAK